MTACEPVRPVRISGAAGLISAVPVLLGFQPAESLVVLGMRGRRRRLGPAMRIDLPPSSDVVPVVEFLADHAERQADRVAVLCFSDADHARDALDLLLNACRCRRLGVLDAILVRSDHAEFLPDDAGVTASTIPLPDDDDPTARALMEASVLAGQRVLRSREELRASVAPPVGPAAMAARTAVRQTAAALGAELADAVDRAGLLRRAAAEAIDAAAHEHATAHRVSTRTAARLALTVCDRWARDALVVRVVGDRPAEWVPVLLDAVGRVPADVSADLCSLLAVTAYRSGDGALALVTLDRCLAAEPRHRFGLMLQQMLFNGLAPDELDVLARPLPAPAQPPSEVRHTLAVINRAAGGSLRPRPASRPATPASSADGPGSPRAGT